LPPLAQIVNSAWIIVLAPFITGLIIILGLRKSKTASMLLSVGTVTYGFIHSLLIYFALTQDPSLAARPPLDFPWFVSSSFTLSIGVLVDNLAAMMLIVVTAVSLLVQVYTHGYMREDNSYSRFYAYLSLFTGSMLGLVVATNLFQMYFFWELVGVCSYFLIGYWWYKEPAAKASLKAFLVNRIGDALFLVGILMLFAATKDYWGGHTVLAFTGAGGYDLASVLQKALASGSLTYWGVPGLFVLSMLIFCGPIAKSAQFPFHVWLPDAMEGPTPISALIHAATMVAAGVYLVARAYPLWLPPPGMETSPGLQIISWVGGFTAFMAATIAMSQFDIKRTLAWSTVSQLGYMFVGLGCGAFTGGLFHLFNHAFFKAMLFLCSGAVIHGIHGEQDMRKMGGLFKSMPKTAWCYLIGCISISGFPGFSGFFSKDTIIAGAWHVDKALAVLMIITAAMTAFYMFRSFYMTFCGAYRGDAHPHESPLSMTVPLMVLAVPSIFSGYLGVNPSAWGEFGKLITGGIGSEFGNHFASFVYFRHPEAEAINGGVMLCSVAAALGGWAIAHMVYQTKSLSINTAIAKNMPALYKFSLNKWYFDELYMAVATGAIGLFTFIWEFVDKFFVDSFIVNGAAHATEIFGKLLTKSQNGRGQYYAIAIFGWVAVLTLATFFLRP
jgi:proton-translocating NADH-quinone oxidoreductase chain L